MTWRRCASPGGATHDGAVLGRALSTDLAVIRVTGLGVTPLEPAAGAARRAPRDGRRAHVERRRDGDADERRRRRRAAAHQPRESTRSRHPHRAAAARRAGGRRADRWQRARARRDHRHRHPRHDRRDPRVARVGHGAGSWWRRAAPNRDFSASARRRWRCRRSIGRAGRRRTACSCPGSSRAAPPSRPAFSSATSSSPSTGKPWTNPRRWSRCCARTGGGKPAALTVIRGGEVRELAVTIGERPLREAREPRPAIS